MSRGARTEGERGRPNETALRGSCSVVQPGALDDDAMRPGRPGRPGLVRRGGERRRLRTAGAMAALGLGRQPRTAGQRVASRRSALVELASRRQAIMHLALA